MSPLKQFRLDCDMALSKFAIILGLDYIRVRRIEMYENPYTVVKFTEGKAYEATFGLSLEEIINRQYDVEEVKAKAHALLYSNSRT